MLEPGRRVRFERIQDDDRDHAEWVLTATVAPGDGGASVTTELTYTGGLWGSGVLQRVLDDEIRRGKDALRRPRQRRAHALKRPFGRRSSSRSSPNVALRRGGVEDVGDRPGARAPGPGAAA